MSGLATLTALPRILTLVLPLVLAPVLATAGDGHPPVFGYLEDALLLPQGFAIKAKLDTGADNSSVHTEAHREFERDGKEVVAVGQSLAEHTFLEVAYVDGRGGTLQSCRAAVAAAEPQ